MGFREYWRSTSFKKKMLRPDKIDLFDLSNYLLDRLNCKGKFKLTHYDFELKFRRDINYSSDKFNIYLILFHQEIAVTYYTIDYNTIDKIINLLFVHLRDDYGYETIESVIISTIQISLERKLAETIHEIHSILTLHQFTNCIVYIDEQLPDTKVDEKGLPIYELNIYSQENKIDIKIELNNTYNDKRQIIEIVKSKLNAK